jgi:8-oxo-dGTP diphosphatase
MTRSIIALVFRCKSTGGFLTVSDEVTAFRWASGTEIAELADEAFAVRVLDAIRQELPPAIRAQPDRHGPGHGRDGRRNCD